MFGVESLVVCTVDQSKQQPLGVVEQMEMGSLYG